MRRSLGLRVATLFLAASIAVPAFAAPRDDSPFDGFGRAISRIVNQVKHIVLDLGDLVAPPH
jgi:hypothetical protein